MKRSLTAIVPVYNEENFIYNSLVGLIKVNEINKILVVDDGSSDSTVEKILEIMKTNEQVQLFQLNKNKGKGGAIKSVFNKVDTDYVVIHDADYEYDPSDISKMYKELNNYTEDYFVIGSRFKNSSKVQLYFRTYYGNKILSYIFSKIYNIKISDIATCYKLMPASYLKSTYFTEDRFAIEVELVAKYLKYNSNIIEVPINYKARSYEEGKKIKFSDGVKYLYTMVKFKYL